MTVPKTFKAAVVPEPKKQHIIADRSLQPLQSGEVAIKITATAINPIDWKMRDHNVILQELPAVLGSDGAGEIAAVGPDVSDFSVGDRVFFQGTIGNYDASTFQQFANIDSKLAAKTPSNISDDEASTIFVTSVAALVAFYDRTGRELPAPWDKGGDSVGNNAAIVIIGGSSSMGQYAIQMARLSGYSKIITNSSPQHKEFLQNLGATAVLDRQATADDFVAAVGYTPLDFILDTISARVTKQLSVDIVRGAKVTKAEVTKIVIVLIPDLDFEEFDAEQEPKATLHRILGVGSFPQLRYLSEPFVKHLGGEDGYIARGLFKPNRLVVVPGGLAGVDPALEKSKKGVSGEKVVIRPFE
ncbi:GroES-like protein [Trichoderma citrinoviride]|uniref:GroES-like protein n=1 Tax=Trichoderma citrinoviride TaxID=58853 RepID=A0A2T4AX80_9HYPO|nr:GroES-like protein [Trichoderma citrinoviride]PTB61687.1 GroES-like protein [Trichoderma citrinoviride]